MMLILEFIKHVKTKLFMITVKKLFKDQIQQACSVSKIELSFWCLGPLQGLFLASSLNPYFYEFAGCVQWQRGYLMRHVSVSESTHNKGIIHTIGITCLFVRRK